MRRLVVALLAWLPLLSGCMSTDLPSFADLPVADDTWRPHVCDPAAAPVASPPMRVPPLFLRRPVEVGQAFMDAVGLELGERTRDYGFHWEGEDGALDYSGPWDAAFVTIRTGDSTSLRLGNDNETAQKRIAQVSARLGLVPPVELFPAVNGDGAYAWDPVVPASWPEDIGTAELRGRAQWGLVRESRQSLTLPVTFEWPEWPDADVRATHNITDLLITYMECRNLERGREDGVHISTWSPSATVKHARVAIRYLVEGDYHSEGYQPGDPHPCNVRYFVYLDHATGAILDEEPFPCI